MPQLIVAILMAVGLLGTSPDTGRPIAEWSTAPAVRSDHPPRGPGNAARPESALRMPRAGVLDVHGTLRDSEHRILSRADLRMTLSTGKRFPATIAATHSDRHGRYHLRIERTRRLHRFARGHGGRLNVMLWAKKGHRVHIRAMQFPYSSTGKSEPLDFSAGQTRLPLSKRISTRDSKTLVDLGAKRLDSAWQTIGTLSAPARVKASIDFHEDLETTYSVAYELGGSWSIGGSAALEKTSGAGLSATLVGPARRNVDIGLDLYEHSVCMGYLIPACWRQIDASWNGGFRDRKAEWMNCGDVDLDNVRWFRPGRTRIHVEKNTGRAFTSTGSIGVVGSGLTLTIQNSETNEHRWTFPRASATRADFFCMAGTDDQWTDASDVITGAHIPHGH